MIDEPRHTTTLLRGVGPDLGPLARRFPQPERTMLHVLRYQAAERGDREWLRIDGRDSLTFAQAYAQANQVGHAIMRDVGWGPHVGLYLSTQVEFFPIFYGAMAAGGVAVPINADLRGSLLRHVVVTSDVRIVATRTDLIGRLAELDSLGRIELIVAVGAGEPPSQVNGVRVVRYAEWAAGQPADPPGPLPDSSDVGVLMFTSGTTGNSKGVICPHHFVYLYAVCAADTNSYTPDDVLFAATPLYHALALHMISNAALHAGCRAELRSRFSVSAFWDQIAESGATYTILLGPLAQLLAKTADSAPPHSIKVIYCPPYPPNGEEFTKKFNAKLVWQGFGMTEIMPNPFFDHDPDGVPHDSAGYPSAWLDYGVVDERDRMLPFGDVGQLVFRPRITDAMARGYYKNPEATVAAFRNMMFHTGDLVVADGTGRIYYRGRMSDRIRRRGENVSAAELEEIVASHPSVIEAAAYAVSGEFGEDEIKLDVIPMSVELSAADLHAWLTKQVPRFMLPRFYELCSELPKTPSGKIEKHKLAARGVTAGNVIEIDPRPRA